MCRQCITQLSVSSRVNFCWLASLRDRSGVMQHGKTGACRVSDFKRHSCQSTLVAPQMLRRCASGISSVPQLRRRLRESAPSSRQNGHPAYAVKGCEENNRRLYHWIPGGQAKRFGDGRNVCARVAVLSSQGLLINRTAQDAFMPGLRLVCLAGSLHTSKEQT